MLKINAEKCKGCGLCKHVCKDNVIEIGLFSNSKGISNASIVDIDRCRNCGMCAMICPDNAIILD